MTEMLHPPPGPSPVNPGRWAKLGDALTTFGAIATAIGTALAGLWKGWKEWKAAGLRKRIAELQRIDARVKTTLTPLFDDLKTTLENQIQSLSVESDRRHRENRGDIAPLKVVPGQIESIRGDIGRLSERVARVEESTKIMYGIIERRNEPRE